MSIFGFSTQPSTGGDFLPVLKYDARAGRFFRVDRVNTGGGFVSEPVDVTNGFKAVFDLENVETGWLKFTPGAAPDFCLVRMGQPLPPRPSDGHRNGVRLMVKLAKEIGGDRPIREVANNALAFLSGLEALHLDWQAQKAGNEGKLPVVALESTLPITSGSGTQKSTNYQPRFKIVGWAPRGDLVFKPKTTSPAEPSAMPSVPPSTGSTRVDPPAPKQSQKVHADSDDDWGRP
jgi:hypothetical protein